VPGFTQFSLTWRTTFIQKIINTYVCKKSWERKPKLESKERINFTILQKRQVCIWHLWILRLRQWWRNTLKSFFVGRDHLEYRAYNSSFSLFSVTELLILSLNVVIRLPLSFSFQTDPVEQKIWFLAVFTMPNRPLRCSWRLVISLKEICLLPNIS